MSFPAQADIELDPQVAGWTESDPTQASGWRAPPAASLFSVLGELTRVCLLGLKTTPSAPVQTYPLNNQSRSHGQSRTGLSPLALGGKVSVKSSVILMQPVAVSTRWSCAAEKQHVLLLHCLLQLRQESPGHLPLPACVFSSAFSLLQWWALS